MSPAHRLPARRLRAALTVLLLGLGLLGLGLRRRLGRGKSARNQDRLRDG
jgi:hypothetical protein